MFAPIPRPPPVTSATRPSSSPTTQAPRAGLTPACLRGYTAAQERPVLRRNWFHELRGEHRRRDRDRGRHCVPGVLPVRRLRDQPDVVSARWTTSARSCAGSPPALPWLRWTPTASASA